MGFKSGSSATDPDGVQNLILRIQSNSKLFFYQRPTGWFRRPNQQLAQHTHNLWRYYRWYNELRVSGDPELVQRFMREEADSSEFNNYFAPVFFALQQIKLERVLYEEPITVTSYPAFVLNHDAYPLMIIYKEKATKHRYVLNPNDRRIELVSTRPSQTMTVTRIDE